MDDADLKRAAWRSIVAFQRLFGLHAPDSELLDHDDYVASKVPASHSSLINAVVPIDAIAPHLDDIVRFYADVPKWGVWLDPANTSEAEAVAQRGLVLDSTPVLMAAELTEVEAHEDPRVTHVAMDELGIVNDAAYDVPAGTLCDPLAGFPSSEVHAYGIRELKEAMSVGLTYDVDHDAFVSFVATLPANRGERLASRVLAHALHDARTRGQTTTSLQASKPGQGLYARLGYRALGEIHLYEKRP